MCRFLFLFCSAIGLGQDTRVILLGTGTPNPEPDRMGPSVAVVSGGRVYIVDSGPGVVRRAAEAGIAMQQITRAFVTHLHSDHTAGLADLILTPAVTGRLEPFLIFGPPGLRTMTGNLMKAYREDIDLRLHGMEPAVAAAYQVVGRDVRPGEIYRDETMRVEAIAVKHGSWKHAYGYKFTTKDKVIVISGDTTYSEAVVEAARGADILVHEVYSEKGWARRTAEWRKYHAAFHTSGPDVGRVASKAGVKKLVLYHQLPMGETAEQILDEVRTRFVGVVVYGKDLDVIR